MFFLTLRWGFLCNKIKYQRAAITLQEPARLLQHLFDFIKMFISPIPSAKHKTHNTQRNKMTTDYTEL